MGFFSRKDKSSAGQNSARASIEITRSNLSVHSAHSYKSPTLTTPARSSTITNNRTSSGPGSPFMPFSAASLPKMDIPRPPDPQLDPAGYLRSLHAVRERSRIVTDKACKNELRHFDVDMSKFPDVVSFVSNIIKRDYDAPFASIPGHGRYQHFSVGGRDRIAELLGGMPDHIDEAEKCRRLVDLFLVSVLLDAGAGTEWSYKSIENGRIYRRSEGIAIASLEMFKSGLFSSHPGNKLQVDKDGLKALTVDKMAAGIQSRPGNALAGIEGRTQLLVRLSDALDQSQEFFGRDGRPGNMIDHLLSHPSTQKYAPITVTPITVLWNVLMTGLAPIWPESRTKLDGASIGDAWPCLSMPRPLTQTGTSAPALSVFPSGPTAAAWESILPFHKLTQWLCYSLMQPMQSLLKLYFAGVELMTGLPEYRNGGLFIDMGVLTLKTEDEERGLSNYTQYYERSGTKGVEVAPMFEPGDDVIVEWRGTTVGFLDKLCAEVNKALKSELAGHELTLAQVLEAGSWKGGREIAEFSRPNTKEPPILIESDGTVF